MLQKLMVDAFAYPPMTKTFSWPDGLQEMFKRLMPDLISCSSPLMYTAPSFSIISNFAMGSSAVRNQSRIHQSYNANI